jgi:hypothetical protein
VGDEASLSLDRLLELGEAGVEGVGERGGGAHGGQRSGGGTDTGAGERGGGTVKPGRGVTVV